VPRIWVFIVLGNYRTYPRNLFRIRNASFFFGRKLYLLENFVLNKHCEILFRATIQEYPNTLFIRGQFLYFGRIF